MFSFHISLLVRQPFQCSFFFLTVIGVVIIVYKAILFGKEVPCHVRRPLPHEALENIYKPLLLSCLFQDALQQPISSNPAKIMSSTNQIPEKQKAVVINESFEPEVKSIPVTKPGNDQVLIKAKAFAVNPTDWKHISAKFGEVNSIVGCDASGVVVEVGSNVKSIKVGDNVSTFLHGSYKKAPYPGAFCEYVLGTERVTYKYDYELETSDSQKIPIGNISSFEDAASVTLSLVTIGYSFYFSLGLDKANDYSNESILIWSGSTAAGSIAIQVASWLGFKNVIVTSSPTQFDVMKQYGATHVYNYKDSDIIEQVKKDFGQDITYALDTFSTPETVSTVYQILSDTKDSHLDNLLFLNEKDLKVPKLKSTNVTFGNTLAYPAIGEDSYFGKDVFIPATQEVLSKYEKFKRDIQPFLNSKKLLHIPIEVRPKGLYGIKDALALLEKGSHSNLKYVLRQKDTKA